MENQGKVWVEHVNGKIVSYLRGELVTIAGTKVFIIHELECSGSPSMIDFVKRVFLSQGEFFQHFIYYRKKNDSVYWGSWLLPGNKWSIQKLPKEVVHDTIRTDYSRSPSGGCGGNKYLHGESGA